MFLHCIHRKLILKPKEIEKVPIRLKSSLVTITA